MMQVWNRMQGGRTGPGLMDELCPQSLLSLCCPTQKKTLLAMLRETAAPLQHLVAVSVHFHVGRYNRIITDAVRAGLIPS